MTTTAPSVRCLNAVVAAMFLAFAVYGVVVPALTPVFPSAEIAHALRNVGLRRTEGRRRGLS